MFAEGAYIAMGMSIATLVVAFMALKSSPRLFFALVISLFGARYLTHINASEYHFFVMLFCAGICVIGREGFISIDQNEVNYAVAVIYWLRMLVSSLLIFGWIGSEPMWLISIVLLGGQLILIAGDSLNGKRINDAVGRGRAWINAVLIPEKGIYDSGFYKDNEGGNVR